MVRAGLHSYMRPLVVSPGQVYIYTISDPISGLVFYVGKTKDPKERFRKHLTSTKVTTKSRRHITGLLNKGLNPVFEIIDTCTENNWQEKEQQYIMIFKSIGANLLNQLPGGEGGPTMLGRKLTEDQRRKISDSKIGKVNTGASVSNKLNKGTKVYQYDLSGNFIAEHLSINDAAKSISRSARRIQKMISGEKVNHVGGFAFKAKIAVNGAV